MQLTPEERTKQEHYRDARFTDKYDDVWQSVGKCVFCDMRDKYIFFEENGVVMTVSLFAYIDGHFMIVPRRHVRSPKELTALEWDTIRRFTYIAKKLIKDVHGIKGMQLVQKDGSSAQSTVDQHLHFHCIPFDAPDLSVWNYRKLTHTPIESASMYRGAARKIIKADLKFEQKYRQPYALPVTCDLVIVNADQEVLLAERTPGSTSIVQARDTLPGGHVQDFSRTLEEELAREVKEETGLVLDPAAFKLVASRIDGVSYRRHSEHLGQDYELPWPFIWNTYRLQGGLPDALAQMTAGDDAHRLHWLPLADVADYDGITPETRAVILKATA